VTVLATRSEHALQETRRSVAEVVEAREVVSVSRAKGDVEGTAQAAARVSVLEQQSLVKVVEARKAAVEADRVVREAEARVDTPGPAVVGARREADKAAEQAKLTEETAREVLDDATVDGAVETVDPHPEAAELSLVEDGADDLDTAE
jgi:hypothetical protein